jgi:hypothetical protein
VSRVAGVDADAEGRAPGQDDRCRDRTSGPVERDEMRVVLRRERLAAVVGDRPPPPSDRRRRSRARTGT